MTSTAAKGQASLSWTANDKTLAFDITNKTGEHHRPARLADSGRRQARATLHPWTFGIETWSACYIRARWARQSGGA